MRDKSQKPIRWICKCDYATLTIFEAEGGKFNLCVGDNKEVIGTYSSPEEAVIALAAKSTQNEEWNRFFGDKDVPKKFRDWKLGDDELDEISVSNK